MNLYYDIPQFNIAAIIAIVFIIIIYIICNIFFIYLSIILLKDKAKLKKPLIMISLCLPPFGITSAAFIYFLNKRKKQKL